MSEQTAPAKRPRRLRITLGAMMAVVLIIGGALGWIVHRARVQRDAVAAIKKGNRGGVTYDWQLVAGKADPKAKPRGPKWLREALGPDAFDTVVRVGLRGDAIDDELLEHVGKLDRVESLNIQGSPAPGLSPNGIAHLRSLTRLKWLTVQGFLDSHGFVAMLAGKTNLRHLWLQQAAVTDEEMAMIGEFTQLDDLALDGSKVTDRGFAHLANLKKLTHLELPGVTISDLSPIANIVQLDFLRLAPSSLTPRAEALTPTGEGPTSLEPLRRLTKLKLLFLGSVRIDDRELSIVAGFPSLLEFMIGGKCITEFGLARIAESPNLHGLWIANTSIADLKPLLPRLGSIWSLHAKNSPLTDEGIQVLANFRSLRMLGLSGTNVTDAGLDHVSKIVGLDKLLLDQTAITDAGIARLKTIGTLQLLTLDQTRVTDVSVPTISGFKKLTILSLYQTGMSPEGISQIRKALPRARITTTKRPFE